MSRFFAAALILTCGLIFWPRMSDKRSVPTRVPSDKSAMTGEFDLVDEKPAPPAAAGATRAATVLEAIEHFAGREKAEHLERMFSSVTKMDASEKAALIDAAFVLDDPRLISRAESLALEMINEGSEADVLMVLPKIAMFPENSPLHALPQESLCRFRGFGLEVVKLKYDRVFRGSRPWASVCGAG